MLVPAILKSQKFEISNFYIPTLCFESHLEAWRLVHNVQIWPGISSPMARKKVKSAKDDVPIVDEVFKAYGISGIPLMSIQRRWVKLPMVELMMLLH